MNRHPHYPAMPHRRRFLTLGAPTRPSPSALVTIARQDAEIRTMRRKFDAIEGLVNDANFRPMTPAALLVFYHAVRQVLMERQL